jgi:ABC-type polysaccharide/polyol phosphate export permease
MLSLLYIMNGMIKIVANLAFLDFKNRVEHTYLGFFWYLLDPLLYIAVLYSFRSHINVNVHMPYLLFLVIGVIQYGFFRKTLVIASKAFQNSFSIMKTINIPIIQIPYIRMVELFYSHLVEFCLMSAVIIYYHVPFINFLPLFFLYIIWYIFLQGVMNVVSLIGVYVLDMSNIAIIFSQLLLFASPVFYIPKEGTFLEILNDYNPIALFLGTFREIVNTGHSNEWFTLIIVSLGLFLISHFILKNKTSSILERL